MTSIPCLSGILRTLFERDAPVLAHQMGLRQRVFNGTSLALLLVFGWLQHPQAGPSALAREASQAGDHDEQTSSAGALDQPTNCATSC